MVVHGQRFQIAFGGPAIDALNIASAMASPASDKTTILNSIRLPRAGTQVLQEEAQATHESDLFELWSRLFLLLLATFRHMFNMVQ